MNIHQAGDTLLLAAAKMLGKPFFAESVETDDFAVHLERTQIALPPIDGVGEQRYGARSGAYEVSPRLNVLHWAGQGAPLLIYHQGGAEKPYDGTPQRMYPEARAPLTVIAVEAPFQASIKEINTAFRTLDAYVASIAIVVQATESLLQRQFARAASVTIVSGYSLGGFVTNRHHLYFNSADCYAPFMAGTRHGEIFLSSVPAAPEAFAQSEKVRRALNFDTAWSARVRPNVHPVLGRFDRLNKLEVQAPSYDPTPYEVWEGGHLFGTNRPHLVREKIERTIKAHEGGARPSAALSRPA